MHPQQWLADLRDPEERNRLRVRAIEANGAHLRRLVRLRQATLARRQRLIAVTGSEGKTSTVRCIRAALGLPASGMAERNYNWRAYMSLAVLLQSPFRRWTVAEVGISGAGQMRGAMRLLAPDVSVVTCLGTEHLRAFASVEALRDEKAVAIRRLRSSGTAILNGDDPSVSSMAAETAARVVTFGFGERSAIRATNLRLEWPKGMAFTLTAGGKSYEVTTRLIGTKMVYCVLAAAAVAMVEGVPLGPALDRIARVRPTRRRNQPLRLASGGWAIVDEYKSALETAEAAVELLAEVPASRRFVILGGLDTPPKPTHVSYRRVALSVAAVADRVVVVGGGSVRRYYWPGFRDGGMTHDTVTHVRNATEAAALLRDDIGPNDVVLIKGRGEQRLVRAALALAGRTVRCRRETCDMEFVFCEQCPLLEKES